MMFLKTQIMLKPEKVHVCNQHFTLLVEFQIYDFNGKVTPKVHGRTAVICGD